MSTPIKIFLLLAGAIIIALMARSLYINLSPREATPPQPVTEQIRVATAILPAGLLLRNEDFEWKAVPRTSVPAGAMIEGRGSDQDITGVMVRRDIAAGSPILERDIIRPNAPGFLSAVLKPGMRAVSVAIDNVSGNAGLIQPGDYVDMILVQETGGRGGSTESNRVLRRLHFLRECSHEQEQQVFP